MRKKVSQTKLNITVAICYQIVAAVIGLILPRFVLNAYGSETNGILQSVSQLLSYTAILECGLGGMIATSFYKPLAKGNTEEISDIFNNAKNFFTKLSIIYIVFMLVLACTSKFVIHTSFDWFYVCGLVLILGVNNYFSYYFAMAQQLLLRADQKIRITQIWQIVSLVLNAGICILMIELGMGVHTVKLFSAIIFLIVPFALRIYVKKHYKISKKIFDKSRKLPEKSSGMIHQLSYFIHANTDMVILSVFKGVKIVSVYSVYNVVIVAMANLLKAISNGIAGKFGNIIARSEKEELSETFEVYNTTNMIISSFFCTMTAICIIPFVTIYTGDVTDINYVRPVFATLFIMSAWFSFIRIPHSTTITSAGHYRQTRMGAVGEVSTNLILSLALVIPFGLSGVAVGTLAAMIFRTVYTIWYLKDNIIKRSPWLFLKESMANLILGVVVTLFVLKYVNVSSESLLNLAFDAVVISVVVLPLFVLLNILLNKEIRLLLKKRKNK